MSLAIRAEGLSKSYRLGVGGNAHPTLRETIAGLSRRLVRGRLAQPAEQPEPFWALQDISFEVPTGEVLGIVGPNGAGKTTLLKILAEITRATRGRVEIDGRIGALLEVGAGFHQELTGRENIFLNGAILGMSRKETAGRLDEIVDFAGIEPFLDTPVKRYSSGMYLRLAFAVAAHIDPDILIVDEVLAVGDADFQRKCMAKTEAIAGTGRTVLFISHQMSMVQKLCTRCILIQNGRLMDDGPTGEVIPRYLTAVESLAGQDLASRTKRSGRGRVRITEMRIESPDGAPAVGSPARIVFRLEGESVPVDCSFTIYDELGHVVTAFDSAERSDQDRIGTELACDFDTLLLRPGRYRINAALSDRDGTSEDHLEGALVFDVIPGLLDGRRVAVHRGYGSIAMPHRWTRTER